MFGLTHLGKNKILEIQKALTTSSNNIYFQFINNRTNETYSYIHNRKNKIYYLK